MLLSSGTRFNYVPFCRLIAAKGLSKPVRLHFTLVTNPASWRLLSGVFGCRKLAPRNLSKLGLTVNTKLLRALRAAFSWPESESYYV